MEKDKNEYFEAVHHYTVCAQCGYRFVSGDEALVVKQTGDMIHRDCYMDYNEDNMNELCESIEY